MDTRQAVRDFVTSSFFVSDEGSLTDSASLLELGVVDSTGVLEIITFLASAFGVTVEDDELVPENLDSIERITAYVTRKVQSSSAAAAESTAAAHESARPG